MKEQMTEQGKEAVRNAEAEEAVLNEVCSVAGEEEKIGFWRDNRGVGVVEVILILVVLIALVLIFKEQLSSMVTKAMEALEKSMNEVLS
jgi:Flp pilus assembly protein TadG